MSAFFVLILALTGLCLNHVSGWDLDSKAIKLPVLLELYGMPGAVALQSYPLGDAVISSANNDLFYNADEIAHCNGLFVGALKVSDGMLLLACERQLLLFTPNFELIEKLGPELTLPVNVKRIGLVDGRVVLDADRGLFFADLEALAWTELSKDEVGQMETGAMIIQWSRAEPPPPGLEQTLLAHFTSDDITYERLLLDIHSGRILGAWGVYLVDIMALLFALLAISGVVIWARGRKV